MSENQPRTKVGAVNKEIILKELRRGSLTFGEIILSNHNKRLCRRSRYDARQEAGSRPGDRPGGQSS